MKKMFYSRLAATNLRKNKSIYLPYFLAGALIVALYYILRAVAVMVLESKMEGYAHVHEMLTISAAVCGILSLIVLFYINSFIMKQRKKEFGLYNILGMGKRHIALVIAWEMLFTALLCIAGGIGGGALLSQLLFLVLLHLVRLPVALTFRIPLEPVLATAALFCAGFALVLAADIVSVGRSNPVELLRSARQGEREPKSRRILAALGVLTLGGGYLTAWSVKSPYDALDLFLPAVLLVIIGTFLLFIAGSIALLKLLRRKKDFYYKPGNFIAVSGMLYRMKQNAAGLANICILSTCVLVTLSSTVCLFLGEEDLLKDRFPRQVHVNCVATADSPAQLERTAAQHAARNAFSIQEPTGYYNFEMPALLQDGQFIPKPFYHRETYTITFLTLGDYRRMTGSTETLAPGEALAAGAEPGETLSFGELRFTVKGTAIVPELLDMGQLSARQIVAVLPSLSDLEALSVLSQAAGYEHNQVWYDLWYDVQGDAASLDAFYDSMGATFRDAAPDMGLVDSIDAARRDFYQIYGSLLFVGIFFVALFLIATVLVIYYKQITEGFDDRARFQIMEKVGMSDREVRGAIQKQVLLVFFLPLGLALAHVAAAFPALRLLLLVFRMDNVGLFAACALGSALLFSVLYFAVYRLTARTYYKIVRNGTAAEGA